MNDQTPTRGQVATTLEIVADIQDMVTNGIYPGKDIMKVARAMSYLETFKAGLTDQLKTLDLQAQAPAIVQEVVNAKGN